MNHALVIVTTTPTGSEVALTPGGSALMLIFLMALWLIAAVGRR